ncbi:MAG: leucine-rich repeat domain-containing protein [Firmicutes bacterium]|nr:leucine-rich repeat domain-containing protein [Bacillota bacterium]
MQKIISVLLSLILALPITSAVIPDSVTSLGDAVFYGCRSLTSLTIPESVTRIGDRAFGGTGSNAFADCPCLTLTVSSGSAAEQYAKAHNIPYVLAE